MNEITPTERADDRQHWQRAEESKFSRFANGQDIAPKSMQGGVDELIAQLTEERDEARKQRDTANFPTKQATECGKCGIYKHTPWRDDEHGYGYICATCLVEAHEEHVAALRADLSAAKEEKSLAIANLAHADEKIAEAQLRADNYIEDIREKNTQLAEARATVGRMRDAMTQSQTALVFARGEIEYAGNLCICNAITSVAAALSLTPSTALSEYMEPRLEKAYKDGVLDGVKHSGEPNDPHALWQQYKTREGMLGNEGTQKRQG